MREAIRFIGQHSNKVRTFIWQSILLAVALKWITLEEAQLAVLGMFVDASLGLFVETNTVSKVRVGERITEGVEKQMEVRTGTGSGTGSGFGPGHTSTGGSTGGGLSIVFAVMLGGALLMGCSLSLKQKVVAAHSGSVTAARAFQDAEIALYDARQIPQLTPEVHIKVQTVLKQVFAVQDAAGAAIQAWRSGTPVPTEVSQWLTEMENSLVALEATIPPAEPRYADLWNRLRSWAKAGADVARLVGVVAGVKTQSLALAGGQ